MEEGGVDASPRSFGGLTLGLKAAEERALTGILGLFPELLWGAHIV